MNTKRFAKSCMSSGSFAMLLACAVAISGCESPTGPSPQPSPTPTPAPKIKVSGNAAFGNVTAGTQATATFTLSNVGTDGATLDSITDSALGISAPFATSGGTCVSGQFLAAGGSDSCTIVVKYSPVDASQASQNMTVKFRDASDLAEQSTQVSLQGTGVLDCNSHPVPSCPKPAPAVSISDGATYDFGAVTVSLDSSHTFVVTNTGNAPATLGTIDGTTIGIATPFSLVGGTCATGLSLPQNGGSCTLVVDYMPVSPVVSTVTIDVQYSGSNLESADATRIIQGTGQLDCIDYPVPACPPPLPVLAFTDSVSPNYGNVNIGSSADATFVLTNEGTVDGTLGTMSDAGVGITPPFSVQGGTCATGLVLQARKGNSCTLIVRFTPQTPGAVPAQTVSVSYSGTNGSSVVTRSIYGTGVLNCQADSNLLSYFNQGETAATNDNSSAAAQGTTAGNAASSQTGYNDGYAATYTAVYNSAYQKAYTAAYNAAYPTAYNNAYNQTCPGGTSAGTSDGNSEGATTGQHDGYQAGYNAAYPTAYTDGYNQGYAAGKQACSQAAAAVQLDAQIRALVAARQGGTTSGAPSARTQTTPPDQNPSNEQACYNQGYNDVYNPNAYQQAYATAVKSNPNYQQGYAAGTNQASTDAQAAGTAKGTPDGTAAAQNDGATNGSADGYNKCYQAAYTSAYNAAYTTAYNAAYPNGSNAGDADGTSVGYTDGYNAAANCGNTAAAVEVVKVSRGLAPTTRFMPSYGSGQSWAVAGPNGLVLDVFAQKPVMRGAPTATLNRDLRNQSLELMQRAVEPALRLQLLLQRRAGQASLR